MSIVADEYDHVIGVDTHARTHTYAILEAATGRLMVSGTFPTTPGGMSRAISWVQCHAGGSVLAAVEGTGSYGATLTRRLAHEGIDVREVKPPRRNERRTRGKSDELDAIAAARTAIASPLTELAQPRADGARSALRVLLVARQALDSRRTADKNTLLALLRSFDLGIDSRKALTITTTRQINQWRPRPTDDDATATIRGEARRLADSALSAMEQLKANEAALTHHVELLAPGLQNTLGVGPVTGAIILTAYSHPGRIRSEAAFANMAGVAPLEASSGNTIRHRLSRRGDRQLNRAIDVIARTRMTCDLSTRAYIERRTKEGRTPREIRRSLKRYIARQLFRQLGAIMT
ncbi:IS110 family transposase [Rhodococcus sp. IEGM 1379]|uniref:IS110 family transposase n=1 Tax=Rhodococcus sp. IEGM 1379 TaxID=3047086 RepID=UPI0024B71EF6|nr:IS110 family transposase [Rhodococcus sp. IEGM 1379]MDI9915432.1 IS110 family transposase [Rhodococcus sp. IEGM 1379]